KESLWVKWINVVKLKQRSVWDVKIDSKDSWGWKCLLNLRSWVGNHMRYKIGDGKSISVWHDKWNSDVSLLSMISKKEIFYAGFKDQDKIQDVLDDNGWKWPQNWKDKYPWITNIQTPYITNQPDQAIWLDNNGKEKRFSTNTVWKDVRGNHGKVNWYKIVWHSNCIPKHTFLLWIAARNKLCTQDKMGKWYPNKVFTCSLCKKVPDSHEHLFFKCEYAQKVWKMVCNIAKLDLKENKWDKILEEMSKSNDNNNIWGVIRRLCLAAAVYFIWQERNMRLFNNCSRDENELFKTMCEEIKAKMVSLQVKQSKQVLQAEVEWNIRFSRRLLPAMAGGQLGDAQSVGSSGRATDLSVNKSFTGCLVMPSTRA
ncbi:RNA-directed DNA polymerase, eukaryota, reverse transcriptase zinc-binding domain protein, partial [Tanacetum coccineum]